MPNDRGQKGVEGRGNDSFGGSRTYNLLDIKMIEFSAKKNCPFCT